VGVWPLVPRDWARRVQMLSVALFMLIGWCHFITTVWALHHFMYHDGQGFRPQGERWAQLVEGLGAQLIKGLVGQGILGRESCR
jgi:hypothetical protein